MRLLEYEAKKIFAENGIPVPPSMDVTNVAELKKIWGKISDKVIVKSQIAIGGRGKAGLIKPANSLDEAAKLVENFMGQDPKKFGGNKVEAVLIEERAEILKETYASVAIDSGKRQFLFILCKEGGMDIEQLAKTNPDAIKKYYIDPDKGVTKEQLKKMAAELIDDKALLPETEVILSKLWDIIIKLDGQLVEINPLGIVKQQNGKTKVVALDAKMILDENAEFRQPKIKELQEKKLTAKEKEARAADFAFVPLGGDIAIACNGAGLTLALLDTLTDQGLKPANFLDFGGGANAERVYKAVSLLFSMKPKAVLINVYGGITKCDEVAKGVIESLNKFEKEGVKVPPFYIRMSGNRKDEGVKILQEKNIKAFSNVKDAITAMKKDLK